PPSSGRRPSSTRSTGSRSPAATPPSQSRSDRGDGPGIGSPGRQRWSSAPSRTGTVVERSGVLPEVLRPRGPVVIRGVPLGQLLHVPTVLEAQVGDALRPLLRELVDLIDGALRQVARLDLRVDLLVEDLRHLILERIIELVDRSVDTGDVLDVLGVRVDVALRRT